MQRQASALRALLTACRFVLGAFGGARLGARDGFERGKSAKRRVAAQPIWRGMRLAFSVPLRREGKPRRADRGRRRIRQRSECR
jgi:hypothetical protein